MYRTILAPGAPRPRTVPSDLPCHMRDVFLYVTDNPGHKVAQIAIAVGKSRRATDTQVMRGIDSGLFVKAGKLVYLKEMMQ